MTSDTAFALIFVLAILIVVATSCLQGYRWLRTFIWRFQTYDWYLRKYPQHCLNGRPACRKCNSSNLGVERLLERTYLRKHYCRQCGTSLYHSKES